MSEVGWPPRLSFVLGGAEELQGTEELDQRLGLLAQLGYAGVEFISSSPAELDAEAMSRTLERHRLGLSAFLSGGIYLRHGVSFANPDEEIRARAVAQTRELVAVAREFRAIVVIGLLQGRRSDAVDPLSGRRNIVDCLKRIAEEADRQQVMCVLEPVNHLEVGFTHTVAEALELMSEVESPALRLMADTFHIHIEERSVEGAIRACAGKMAHFHLCDTNRRMLGSGRLDFKHILGLLKEVGYSGYCTVVTEYDELDNWRHEAEAAVRVVRQALSSQ